jgi:hypothetical protein
MSQKSPKINMNKGEFESIILNLQLLKVREHKINEGGLEIANYVDGYYKVINTLLKTIFNDKQLDLIEWFLYERDPKRGLIATETITGESREVCYSIDSVWDELLIMEAKNIAEEILNSSKDKAYYQEMVDRGEI